ncbi:MAG: DEAD/DEAH box helicase, partial [Acidobacteriota bacterium]
MNAIQMTEELRENYVKYLMTTFDLSVMDQALAEALRQKLIAPGVLFQGPYLELNPPYETGSSLRDLVREGVLDERLCRIREDIAKPEERPLPPDRPLYLHQEQAVRRVVTANRNLVVASGTGSGKTESFLIPIINDLIRDNRPGVRAILIYPMNALVNDQLERLRRLLRGTRITFGRYTSELKTKEVDGRNASPEAPVNEVVSREKIRGDATKGLLPDPPQILITNYAMLEHLLIRPEDSPVFETSHLKFICLDEAHTYSGAQGIEVSMLLRRLKHRLGIDSKDLQCIATSATLTPDDREAAAGFASKLFGEKFEEDDVIFGSVDNRELDERELGEPVRGDVWRGISDGLIDRLRGGVAATRLDQGGTDEILAEFEKLGLISPTQAAEVRGAKEVPTLAALLWRLFRFSPEIARLRSRLRQGPLDLRQAAGVVFGTGEADEAGENDDWKAETVCRIVEIGAMARETETSTALFPARYHLFARSPQGAWICLNPECRRESGGDGERRGWSQIFLEKGESCPKCRHALYELIACRSCSQPFIKAFERDGRLFSEAQMSGEAAGGKTRFFTWSPLNDAIGGDDQDEDDEGSGDEDSAEVNRTSVCLKCRQFRDHCGCNRDRCAVDLYRVDSKRGPVERLTTCPRCQKRSGRGGREVATSITVNNSAPLAVLAENLYRSSPKKPGADAVGMSGEGRKLLAFTDSRQGAARFASYLQESSDDIFARHLIYQATLELNESGSQPDIEAVATKALELEHSYKPPQEYIGSSKIARLKDERVKSILAHFCTTLDTRYSLPAIGLVDCVVDIRQSEMPSEELASAFGLDQAALMVAMQVLLDRLRYKGSVTLPPGIRKDDPFFKPASIGNPCQRTKSVTEKKGWGYDIWIHPDDRNATRQTQFDYVRRLLAATGRDSGNAAVRHALGLFWDWATSKRILNNNLMPGNYLIDHRRLNFSTTSTWYQCHKCRRRSTRRLSELIAICPSKGCTGELRPIDTSVENQEDQDDNYYRSIFRRSPIAMRVEEHTAQLKPELGREHQDDFIRGKVN